MYARVGHYTRLHSRPQALVVMAVTEEEGHAYCVHSPRTGVGDLAGELLTALVLQSTPARRVVRSVRERVRRRFDLLGSWCPNVPEVKVGVVN